MGFIVSSDHLSTQMSFAIVYAEDATKEGSYSATKRRRTMARPTRRGPHRRRVLGDDTRVQGEFQTIRALTPGTETIRELALVRNNEVGHTVKPATSQVEFEHTDHPSLLGGILY